MQIINTLLKTNTVLISIFNFPLSFIEILVVTLLFTNLFNINITKKLKIMYIFLLSLSITFSKIIIPIPYNIISNLTIMFLFTRFMLKINSIKSLFCILISYIPMTILGLIICIIIHSIFGIYLYDMLYIPIYSICIQLLIYLLIYLFHLLFKKLDFHINILEHFIYSNRFELLLPVILILISTCYNLYTIFYYQFSLPIIITITSIFLFIMSFILSIYFLIKFNDLETYKKDIENLKLYNKTLSIMHDSIRAFKHDFNNIIQSIGGYIETNNIDGLQKYYKDLLKDCYSVSNLEILRPEIINNPSIYSILAAKYYKANSENITINFDVDIDLNTLNVSIYELTRILGILLDNSIEASQECNEKYINVRFLYDNHNHRQLVIIENTYANKNIDTIKIFEKAYTTKENNTGLGLWEVNQILNKHNNLSLFTSKNDKYFIQQLEIY